MIRRWLAKRIILLSQKLPWFAARGGYSGLDEAPDPADRFAKSEIEFKDHHGFLCNLPAHDFLGMLQDRTVLDYGSGFGGRAVWMAQAARQVEGVEIDPGAVEISGEYAVAKGVGNARFSVGRDDAVLFGDERFDIVVSYDVMEHVMRPDLILQELHRVLRRGGTAIIVFTPYYGMFSHHLNYMTLFPALHWCFPPPVLVDAVNELLASEPAFAALGVGRQPKPGWSFNGKRRCLPLLNGMTGGEYLRLVEECGFRLVYVRYTPILERFPLLGGPGKAANRFLVKVPVLAEYFAHNLVSVLSR